MEGQHALQLLGHESLERPQELVSYRTLARRRRELF